MTATLAQPVALSTSQVAPTSRSGSVRVLHVLPSLTGGGMERATLRRMDKRTGQIYHLKYNPPPPGAELEHRADDQEETVKKRLDEYDAMTAALLPHYRTLGLLRRVDGVGTPQEITQRILGALETR